MGGRVTIVTGATFGLGRSIAIGLAKRGHPVVALGLEQRQISSIAEGGLATLNEEFNAQGLDGIAIETDVSDSAQVASAIELTLRRHGRIDALLNNAAIGPLGTVLDTKEDVFDRIIAVNLKGPYLCARAVLPHMIAQGGGSIINVGSGAGWGKPNMAIYAASKGGLHALSTALAYDHFHEHVRVNTIIPGGGGIVSGMSLGRVGGDPQKLGRTAPGTVAGRPASGEDLVGTIAFLLSKDAEAISGTVIDIGCFSHQGGPVPPKPERASAVT